MQLNRGDLIKWCMGHHSYEAFGDVLVGREPIYKYGVVYEVSDKDPYHFIVIGCDDGKWHLLNTHYDKYEILSEG